MPRFGIIQLLMLVAFLFVAAVSGVDGSAEIDSSTKLDSSELLSIEELRSMPIKKLKSMLSSKGTDCKGCSEKADFVAKAFESQSLPDIEKSPVDTGDGNPSLDQDKIDELMASLKSGGFGNSRMFSANDLKGMSPEELSEKLGSNGGTSSRSKGKSSKKKNSSKSSKKDKKDKDETSKSKSKQSGKSKKSKKSAASSFDSSVPQSGGGRVIQETEYEHPDQTIEL
jgi:hypothetical protein